MLWLYEYCLVFLFPKGKNRVLDERLELLTSAEIDFVPPKMGTHLTIVPTFSITEDCAESFVLGMQVARAQQIGRNFFCAQSGPVKIFNEEDERSLVQGFDLSNDYRTQVESWRHLLLPASSEKECFTFSPHVTVGAIKKGQSDAAISKKITDLGGPDFKSFSLPLDKLSLMKKDNVDGKIVWEEIN